jgi:riboflavin kinase/FMN adenylyltransferase
MRILGQDMGFSVTVIPPVEINGEVVSSTAIRNALAGGDMKKVGNLIGRPFSLYGWVITGAGRGIGLGFPTANLDVDSQQTLPPDGVYATWAYIDGKAYQSMTNIGRRPTFGGSERAVEVYILDYHGELYGHKLRIDIIERLRREERFDTAEELKRQVAEDIKQGRDILNQGRS